jgi:hypothetical protein
LGEAERPGGFEFIGGIEIVIDDKALRVLYIMLE